MRTKIISIGVLMLLFFGLLTCFTVSALPPDPLVVATDPVDGEMGYPADPTMTYLEADFSQLSGHPMMVRCGTNATGTFVWSNWVGPTTNDTINYPFYANLTEHTYYWTVWANDSYGNSSNTTFSFTTWGADPNTTITYPVDGSTISTFTQITGTCDNASSILSVIFFNFTDSTYWNWAVGNWSQADLNTSFTTPIGVTSWVVSADIPTLVSGKEYAIAVYGNSSYNTNFDSVGFTYLTHTHAFSQMGDIGIIAKLIVELCVVLVALALAYFVINDWVNKKKHSIKDTMDMFKTLLIGLIVLGVVAIIVAVL